MSYSALLQLLDSDTDPDQILALLSRNAPSLAKKISRLLIGGSSAKDIISFLKKDKEALTLSPSQLKVSDPSSLARIIALKRKMSGPESQEEIDKENLMDISKKALNTAGAVGGGLIAGRALRNALPHVSNLVSGRGLPRVPGQKASPIAPKILEESQEILPQTAPTSREEIDQTRASRDLITEMGLEKRINNLSANNPPEIVAAAVKSTLTPSQKTWLKTQTNQPIEEIIHEYLQGPNAEKKEELVVLPEGRVGSLIDEKQGIGHVALPDGQIRRQRLSEMDREPPELEEQITNLIESIPEDERSAVLAFASHTPDAEIDVDGKTIKAPFMGVQFHNGDFYMYPGVTKSQFDKVVSKAVKAKTTGSNPWHAWVRGKDSRGAGMHELIAELEKEVGKNFIKFKASEGYDYFKRIRQIVKEIERKGKKFS